MHPRGLMINPGLSPGWQCISGPRSCCLLSDKAAEQHQRIPRGSRNHGTLVSSCCHSSAGADPKHKREPSVSTVGHLSFCHHVPMAERAWHGSISSPSLSPWASVGSLPWLTALQRAGKPQAAPQPVPLAEVAHPDGAGSWLAASGPLP